MNPLVGIAMAVLAADAPLGPTHFAHGFELRPSNDAPVQTALIPLDLYRGVTRADLGDVRVFNAGSEEVPHARRRLDQATTVAGATVSLPIFPLRGRDEQSLDALNLRVQRSESGTILSLRSEPVTAEVLPVRAYLLDGSGIERRVRAFSLDFEAEPGLVAQVTVEASEDLSYWRTVSVNASVARLSYGGHTLERRRITFPPERAPYWRLTWRPATAPWSLTGVLAEEVGDREPPRRQSTELAADPDPDRPGLFDFDAGGPVPVDRISVALPQPNTLVDVELRSAANADGPWRTQYRGLVYRVVVRGQEVTNPEIALTRTRDRYWQLEVDPKGGGLGRGRPRMSVGWLPEQLLFVARGQPPFTLAFGSYQAGPSTFDAAKLLGTVPRLGDEELPEASVNIGARVLLGGDAALEPPPPPVPWKTYLLWATLIFGVIILGAMALRLVKQMRARNSE